MKPGGGGRKGRKREKKKKGKGTARERREPLRHLIHESKKMMKPEH